ncbi:zinc finger protein VAR3, chloroplastic isoform X2 [Rhodamnia argentea]|uniref:Zinc finger protein VAR3, chloroplastic isoform X2 n=1 Tax=Rhodamnia argentea TaxID=178133 RepID=A0A8B8N0B8_9MYRT|nr:zinc finger protein VAR3, chloroplastic isoform X2 [Rhodamnia argentea]
MSASKLFLFGTALFRAHAPLPRHSLRFRGYCSASAAGEAIASEAPQAPLLLHHPWPEWVSFVDRLKAKGYLAGRSPPREGSEEVSVGKELGDVIEGDGELYKQLGLLKDPCLSFARDRYDIFKSLSLQHIQTVVEHGCPNLLRKAVNSGKRLRVYVRLDEGDVCSACNLRGSCDKAYVILKESEAAARTVDIVRILLFYATDPLVFSGGQKPPGRDLVESSARELLAQLVELSETPPDPELPKPATKARPAEKRSIGFFNDNLSQDVEMKRGDWMCPKCNFLNFAKNIRCLKCKEDGPKQVALSNVEIKQGDWICPECNYVNFSRNVNCLKCKTQGPEKVGVDEVEMKKGDWNCPQCRFMNFASKRKCLRCQGPRPKRKLNYGEWECPSCDYLNYRRNTSCLKCNHERPQETRTEYDEQIWRSPR